MKKIYLILLLTLPFLSCDKNAHSPFEEKPISLTSVQKMRVQQDNDFAFELMKQSLNFSEENNVFISPLSVSIALAMLRNGAVNDTKSEIETTLKLKGMSDSAINEYYKLLQNSLASVDPKTKFSIANSIWYRNTFDVKPEFLQTNADYFKAEVASLDFNNPSSVNIINQWCSDKTNGLIPKVLDDISHQEVMFLINAVYFKGIWVKQFDKQQTREQNFTNELAEKVKVNMMTMTDTMYYAADDIAEYLDLPYGNNSFSMTVILPKGDNKAVDLFENISTSSFNDAINKMTKNEVALSFPRFNVNNSLDLIPMLKEMEMEKSFTLSAELDKISNLKPLYIDMVKHDSYVEVTEEGTEAAAVTTIGIRNTSVPKYIHYQVNKPFAFVIREKNTGVILFAGKIGNIKKF